MTAIQLGASIILLACVFVVGSVVYASILLWREHGPDGVLWWKVLATTLGLLTVALFTYGFAFQ